MVMGPEFVGNLHWTVNYADTITMTSDDMLQYNWELEARSSGSVLRDVEPVEAAREQGSDREIPWVAKRG